MLTAVRIAQLFELLNDELVESGETAEIGIVGGAVMCLVFHAREATRDVDAIFKPAKLVRKLVEKIAGHENLQQNWLNDAVKGFIQGDFDRQDIINLSNLRVWAPEPKYLLAMKCLSARWDSSDRDDVVFLLKHLKLRKPRAVFAIIEHYYPKNQIPAKTQFFIEEILG